MLAAVTFVAAFVTLLIQLVVYTKLVIRRRKTALSFIVFQTLNTVMQAIFCFLSGVIWYAYSATAVDLTVRVFTWLESFYVLLVAYVGHELAKMDILTVLRAGNQHVHQELVETKAELQALREQYRDDAKVSAKALRSLTSQLKTYTDTQRPDSKGS